MEHSKTNSMAIASLIFGILTVLSSGSMITSFFAAGTGITLALLSRGQYKMCGMAKIGLFICIVGAIVSFFVTLYLGLLILARGGFDMSGFNMMF